MLQEIVQAEYRDEVFAIERGGVLDTLIHSHLACILGGRTIPSVMLDSHQLSQRPLPLLSRIAIYSLNLVIIQCALHPEGYDLDYGQLSKYLGKEDPWDRLAHLWLAGMPDGARWSIGGLLIVQRGDRGVHLTLRNRFETSIAGTSTSAFNALGLSIGAELRRDSEEAFDSVFALVSHQLKNQFAALQYRMEDMLRSKESGNDASLRSLNAEVGRFRGIVASLRAFGGIASGRGFKMEPVRCSLKEIIMSAVETFAARAERAGVKIEGRCSEAVYLSVDRTLLEQALSNVVDNAIQASSKGQGVSIEGRASASGTVEIAVRDQGPGISAEVKARMFEQYFTTKVKGMGIGLALTKTIVDVLGGTVEVDSSFQSGTTFRFVLPIGGPTN